MALSMEEQRILTQIEARLSEDDPRLAHRLARHGAPPRRVRTVAFTAVVLVTALAVLTAVAATIATAVM